MRVICTYCAAEKRQDVGPLPAIQRYLSSRITDLHRAAVSQGLAFRILSGEFGLLPPEAPIPRYDHLLLPDEVAALMPTVAARLTADQITCLTYHTADPVQVPAIVPYYEVARQACALAGTTFEIVLLAGNPG